MHCNADHYVCMRACLCVEKHVKYCIFIEIHNQSPSHWAINKDQTIGPSEEYLAKVFSSSSFLLGEKKNQRQIIHAKEKSKSHQNEKKKICLLFVLCFHSNSIRLLLWKWHREEGIWSCLQLFILDSSLLCRLLSPTFASCSHVGALQALCHVSKCVSQQKTSE